MTAPDQEPIDLVDALNTGRINRRDFMRRGVLLGLSIPTITALLASCGDDDDDDAEETAGERRHRHGASQFRPRGARARRPPPRRGAAPGRSGWRPRSRPAALDPIAMQDLGTYGIVAQCFEFLCTLGDEGAIAPGLAESWESERRRLGVDVPSAPGRQVARRHRLHVGRRGRHARPPVRRRQRRSRRRDRRRARSTPAIPRPRSSRCSSPNGNFPYLVSVFNAQAVITPVGVHHRHDARRLAQRHRPLEADQLRRRHRRRVRPQRRLVGRRSAARHDDVPVLRRHRVDGHGRRRRRGRHARPVPGGRRRGAVRQPRLQRRRLPGRHPPPDLDALRHGPVHRQAGPSGARLQHRPAGSGRHPVQGQGGRRQRPRDLPDLPVLRRLGATAPVRPRHGQATARRCRLPRRHLGRAPLRQPAGDPAAGAADPGPGGGGRLHARARRREPRHVLRRRSGARPSPPTRRAPAPPSSASSTTATAPRPTCTSTRRCRRTASGTPRSTRRPEFDAAFAAYQAAIGVDAQKAACKTIEEILVEDTPIVVPYIYNYIAGWSTKYDGIRVSALGQIFLDKAVQVA